MGSGNVCCPVCRQFLPKAKSLHEHLNTHPKLQVIEALIQLKDACKDFEPSSSVQQKDNLPLERPEGDDERVENAVDIATHSCTPSAPPHDSDEEGIHETRNNTEGAIDLHVDSENEEKLPPTSVKYALQQCAPSSSTSNLSPYPQFLTGSSPVAQFIHVPVVTSAVPNSTPPPSTQQAPVVLYSPFVCPPSTSVASSSYSSPLNLAQHLQFLVGNSVVRSPFSIIQAHPSTEPSQTGHVALKSEVSSRNNSLTISSNINPKPASTAAESLSEDWVAPGDSSTSLVCSESPVTDSEENSLHENLREEEEKVSDQLESAPETASYVSEVLKAQVSTVKHCNEPHVLMSDLPESETLSTGPEFTSSLEHRTPQEQDLLTPPKKRICFSLGSPSRHSPTDQFQEVSPSRIAQGSPRALSNWNNLGSPGAHSTSSVEGVLRVRSDLNVSLGHSVSIPCEEKDENWAQTNLKKEAHQSNAAVKDLSAACDIDHMPNDLRSNAEKNITFGNVILTCLKKSSGNNANNIQGKNEFEFIIPDVVTESYSDFQDDRSLSRAGSPPCDSAPPSPYQKSLDSPSTPLNIQTDETMPPRGELSEQESIGGNSSSMWSVPAYHITRQLPSPVVSYDLTARESWAGSDVSDSEGNANVGDNHPASFNAAPSFTNTLQPFIPKTSSSSNFVGESPFSSHIQPQIYGEGHSTGKKPITVEFGVSSKGSNSKQSQSKDTKEKKAPSKPRVYRCKECSSVFNTLKLRRLHPCEQMKSTPLPAVHMTSEIKGLTEETNAPSSSSKEGDNCVSKPKKRNPRKPKSTIKKEVIVEDETSDQTGFANQYRISKTEPVDASESQTNPQVVPEISSEPCQSTAFESTEVAYVEVPLVKSEAVSAALGSFGCQKCDQDFKTAKQLSQHMSSKHKDQKYQCTTCGETFDKERNYYDHLMVHPAECQLCGKTFVRRKYLALHMRWHMDEKPHKCVSCNKSFVTKQKLDEHMNTHTGNAPIKCVDCDMTFKRYSNMIQHRNRHHLNLKPKTKDYICHCGEVLHSKKKLEWHKEIHEMKPKSCHYCAEKFVHTASLTRHVRRAHDSRYVPSKKREGENIECPICHLVFLKTSLAGHIKIHGGERPFPCHICGKDFTTKWNLQTHRWTHASRSARQHKCTLCKASFCRRPDYLTHMNSHRNVRPFTCNHCGCQFVRKYNCLRHMRQHEEGKNYTCTICNKTFHRNYYLKDHMRIHNGTRPFTCHICGKASTSKSNHNKHVRIHHAREPHNTEI